MKENSVTKFFEISFLTFAIAGPACPHGPPESNRHQTYEKTPFLHAVACLLADSAEAPALPFCLLGHTFLRFTVPKRIIFAGGFRAFNLKDHSLDENLSTLDK
jgi:hypothetical protein